MAKIFPFPALRYDARRVALTDVVTQPYDKITPAMQERYYAASPYNLVRIILGRPEGGDDQNANVYTRAAQHFQQWRQEGVLVRDPEPSIYGYEQEFAVPGGGGLVRRRRGFIALGQVEDYGAGVVFRHEQTLAKPKADRLNLLRATRAHFGQIFMIYSDKGGAIEALLPWQEKPAAAVSDEYGVVNRLWRVSDPGITTEVQRQMAEKRLIIADGHHRYETALAYRDERRAAAGTTDPTAPYERVMMTFVNMEAEGLLILPTHRVVHGMAGFAGGEMIRRARGYFAVEDVSHAFDGGNPTRALDAAGANGIALLAVTGSNAFLLRAKPGAADPVLASFSERQRKLDVVHLHKVLLETVMGISEEAIRQQTAVTYVRSAPEAVEMVRGGGANVAFVLRAVPIEQMREVAFAGEVMPQKSTDFYPKLLSGLAVYALE